MRSPCNCTATALASSTAWAETAISLLSSRTTSTIPNVPPSACRSRGKRAGSSRPRAPSVSKKNIKTFLDGIRGIIKAALGMSAAALIDCLNPKIRGWSNYHRHVVSKRAFSRVDNAIFIRLWQWARRRHAKKSPRWLKQKYFEQHGGRNWAFFGESCDNEGKPHKVRLLLASSTPIQRH